MTALHWACAKGADGLSAGLKAIRAASVHQPSYIDGNGLILRRVGLMGPRHRTRSTLAHFIPIVGENPPPLFVAVAFGNFQLCEALIKAGCNVNLLQSGESYSLKDDIHTEHQPTCYRIHDKCSGPDPAPWRPDCLWHGNRLENCRTAGHVAVSQKSYAILNLLLDSGLSLFLGTQSLIHAAVRQPDVLATELLLSRHPELSNFRRRGFGTPLHDMCKIRQPRKNFKLPVLLAIGRCLITSGADLEAEIHDSEWVKGTPLQYALSLEASHNQDRLSAAEVLITLGSAWNKPRNPSSPYPDHESILDDCLLRVREGWEVHAYE